MDQHPIPQDVTGFQFKLIGTMTVKQFGYVACGVIFAVILYYMPLHFALGILIKVFLIPLLGASGVIISFVPIDGRPIDVMATNFAKAIFSPNQYVYHRQGRILSFLAVSIAKAPVAKKGQEKTPQQQAHTANSQIGQKEERLRALLLNSTTQGKNDMDKKEAAFLKALTLPTTPPMAQTTAAIAKPIQHPQPILKAPVPIAPIQQRPIPVAPLQQRPMPIASPMIQSAQPIKPSITPPPAPPTPPAPQNTPVKETAVLAKKESELTQALSQAKQEDSQSKTPELHAAAQQKIGLLNKQIREAHAQKQQLEKELSSLQNQLITQKTGVQAPNPVSAQPLQDPQHVRVIPQAITKKVGLPNVSDSPNVVVGIVKDPRGNILPNILVEVKDKEGNPVRAFKTNQLGQFASATPLSPGAYTIELEDPKKLQQFDIVQIMANNQVLLPIEIISHDAREELRRQLFAS